MKTVERVGHVLVDKAVHVAHHPHREDDGDDRARIVVYGAGDAVDGERRALGREFDETRGDEDAAEEHANGDRRVELLCSRVAEVDREEVEARVVDKLQ